MNCTGLLIAVAIAAVVGVIFAIYPDLDLTIESWFLRPGQGGAPVFAPRRVQLRDVISILIALLAAPAFIAFAVKLILPRRRSLLPARAVVLLIATLAIGPGLIVNAILKEHSGRWRPRQVVPLGGMHDFTPLWNMSGSCPKNCSFASGEAAGAFWTLAPAALTPPPWRLAAYGAAFAFGTAVGVLRMSAGGHFFTDVVFAGVIVFMVIWLIHGLLYRWAATRTSDEAVERLVERIVLPIHSAVASIVARIRGKPDGESRPPR